MSRTTSTDIVMAAFAAVERRDERRLAELYHPQGRVPLAAVPVPRWVLPRGRRPASQRQDRLRPGLGPLQPTRRERRMDPRVVAATDKEVVVLWHQRGVRPDSQRLDMDTLGLYGVRDRMFARAQMFYFDTTAVLRFLQQPQ